MVYIVLKEVINFSEVSNPPYTKILEASSDIGKTKRILGEEIKNIVNSIENVGEKEKKEILEKKYFEDGDRIYLSIYDDMVIYQESGIEIVVWIEECNLKE